MAQSEAYIKLAKMHDRQNRIRDIKAELQCIESCLAQGFTLQMYIDSQKDLIKILEGLNKEV